ncbi:hypothetical protein HPO96_33210 [Kribbella sandramycini]|uniref:Uncharacterized protein n=1 Tax=Kribbella sandramycini TaxID=60450 RepID=A0A7Y4L679_9ACTN|nr:hypothetical protein [Kribbella sandramycini]
MPPLVSVPTTPSLTPTETPSTPPSAKVADTLCVRMDQALVQSTLAVPLVEIQPKPMPAEFGVPITYDVCQLQLSQLPNGPVLRVGVSLQLATKTTLAQQQKALKGQAAVVGEGGFGNATSVVFLFQGRLYKVAGPKATLAQYVVLAQDVVRQIPGVPAPETLIVREGCERGTAAVAKVMGAQATYRRDGENERGDLVCGWISTNGVLTTSARRTPQAVAIMTAFRKLPTAQTIPLGEEAYVDSATGRTSIRFGDDKLVDLVPLPARAVDPDAMTQLALAVARLYR